MDGKSSHLNTIWGLKTIRLIHFLNSLHAPIIHVPSFSTFSRAACLLALSWTGAPSPCRSSQCWGQLWAALGADAGMSSLFDGALDVHWLHTDLLDVGSLNLFYIFSLRSVKLLIHLLCFFPGTSKTRDAETLHRDRIHPITPTPQVVPESPFCLWNTCLQFLHVPLLHEHLLPRSSRVKPRACHVSLFTQGTFN